MNEQLLLSHQNQSRPFAPESLNVAYDEINTEHVISHQQIADRAFQIYEKSGCESGHCQRNWKQAEQELRHSKGELKPVEAQDQKAINVLDDEGRGPLAWRGDTTQQSPKPEFKHEPESDYVSNEVLHNMHHIKGFQARTTSLPESNQGGGKQ